MDSPAATVIRRPSITLIGCRIVRVPLHSRRSERASAAPPYVEGANPSVQPDLVASLHALQGQPLAGVSVLQENRLSPSQSCLHAHHKGIIHRDLKPGNVLVSQAPGSNAVVKVIDFGVAKAVSHVLTDKTIFTEFGQILGTPEYME